MLAAGQCAATGVGIGACGMALAAGRAGSAAGRQSVATHCATGQSAFLQHVRAGAAASKELCSTKTSAMTRARNCRMGLLYKVGRLLDTA